MSEKLYLLAKKFYETERKIKDLLKNKKKWGCACNIDR